MENNSIYERVVDESASTLIQLQKLLQEQLKNASIDSKGILEISQAIACLEDALTRFTQI